MAFRIPANGAEPEAAASADSRARRVQAISDHRSEGRGSQRRERSGRESGQRKRCQLGFFRLRITSPLQPLRRICLIGSDLRALTLPSLLITPDLEFKRSSYHLRLLAI